MNSIQHLHCNIYLLQITPDSFSKSKYQSVFTTSNEMNIGMIKEITCPKKLAQKKIQPLTAFTSEGASTSCSF